MCNSSFFKDIFSLFIYLLTISCMYRVYFGHIHPWFPDASSSYTPLSPFQHYDLSFSCSLSLSFKLLCLISAAYTHLGVESSAEAWVGLLRATPLKKRDSSPADPNQQSLFGVVSPPQQCWKLDWFALVQVLFRNHNSSEFLSVAVFPPPASGSYSLSIGSSEFVREEVWYKRPI